MTKYNRYRESEYVPLSDYITPDTFRTVAPEQLGLPRGRGELLVKIVRAWDKKSRLSTLNDCNADEDGNEYGYAKNNERIRAVRPDDGKGAFETRTIGIYEWRNRFLLVFESGDGSREKSFFITCEEVKDLLNCCLRAKRELSE